MNNKPLVGLASLLLLLVLAGCQAEIQSEPTIKENVTNPVPQQTVQPQAQAQQPATMNFTAPNMTGASEADRAAYQAAFSLGDSTYCDQVKDASLKTTCMTELNNNKILNEATSKKDAALCDKMSNKDKQDACKIQVDALMKGEQASLKKEQEVTARETISNQLIKDGDYARCKELQNANAINDCQYNILVNKAAQEKDLNLCDNATQDAVKQACRQEAQKLMEAAG